MEIKKGKINIFIGPSGSKKVECLKKYIKFNNNINLFDKKNSSKTIIELLNITKTNEKKFFKSLEMVGLSYIDVNNQINSFTSNELKRLSIAAELFFKNDNYVFIHPEVGLDDKNRENLLVIFRILKNRFKKTIIVITSDSDWAHRFADFVFVVYNGNVVCSGTNYEIFCNDEICEKYKILVPRIIKFEKMVYSKKNRRLGFRNEINDLIKDIYRNI